MLNDARKTFSQTQGRKFYRTDYTAPFMRKGQEKVREEEICKLKILRHQPNVTYGPCLHPNSNQ